MERDRYPSAEQHDDALNNNHSHAQDNIMEPIITTIVPQTPPPSTHNNNFKIRLVESHHLTNNSNSNQNQSSNNNNSSSSPQSNDCNNDEEALNLVQIPNANGSRNREATPTCATPTPDIQLIKREVKTELSPAENLSNNNGHDDEMAGAGYDRKYDDNNNNSGLDMETDSNNNNSKPGGDNNNGLALALGKHKLLSAINRNIEQDHPDHEHQDLSLGQILVLLARRIQHLLAVRLQDGKGVAIRLRQVETAIAAAQVVVVVAVVVVVVVPVEILHEGLGQRGLRLDVLTEAGVIGIAGTSARKGRGTAIGSIERRRRR